MNEGDESFPSKGTRKKRRRSGFRYSSRKALERSRESRRTAIACGSDFTRVTRALSYHSAKTSETCFPKIRVCTIGSSGSYFLDSVEELHEEWVQMSIGNASLDGDNIQKVSNIKSVYF
jgi:hypothetical protein